VVTWGGWSFWTRAFQSIRLRSPNMFTLIFIGVAAAFLYSLFAFLFPHLIPPSFYHHGRPSLYFESACAITVLVLLGQLLEAKARSHTNESIRRLIQQSPSSARLIQNGSEIEIPVTDVKKDDLLRVKPGDKIPVDGTIIDGKSYLDESMISGESIPAEKKVGDHVIGGTLNQQGSFSMRATRVGSETMLSQMIHLVSEAQRSRAPIQRVADRVSGIFVPAVLIISILTFVIWVNMGPPPSFSYALVNFIAVLIIACPCALGLATPMSIMVGIGKGARHGILIRHAEALEQLEKINILVVDKTGTLTEGKPKVTQIITGENISEEQLLSIAASIEIHSEHPLANAIVNAAKEHKAVIHPVEDFQSYAGEGVTGKIQNQRIFVGTLSFLKSKNLSLVSFLNEKFKKYEAVPETIVWIGSENKIIGFVTVSDPIKKSTPIAIEKIQSLGIKIIMLTGDRLEIAQSVAQSLGINSFKASANPLLKKEEIDKLRKEGHVIAMAGDGINDAPALAAADVGIAMGTGTDIAIESAQITLLKGDLTGIAQAISLSRATMKNIRQNLFFAFVYNIIGVPIAAGILYPFLGILLNPIIASAAMSLSSVSVIANSLRLRSQKL
jgi:Cu+-exporting ATPase